MLFLILFHIWFSPSFAQQTCPGHCSPLLTQLASKDTELKRVTEILKKNEDYLKKNPAASTSITVKIRSNMLISKMQIETVQNEKTLVEQSIREKGCKECKIENTKGI